MRIAETPRLVLRRFRIDDAAAFYALNVDPEVIRYTGDPPFASVDAARDFVERYLGDVVVPNDDLSRWAVVERGGDEMIGFCGLRRQPSGEVDLGFRLLRRLWGRGYATEAARAALEVGFGRYGLDAIVARAHVENAASLAVIGKLQMRHRGHVDEDGMRLAVFVLGRGDPGAGKLSPR